MLFVAEFLNFSSMISVLWKANLGSAHIIGHNIRKRGQSIVRVEQQQCPGNTTRNKNKFES